MEDKIAQLVFFGKRKFNGYIMDLTSWFIILARGEELFSYFVVVINLQGVPLLYILEKQSKIFKNDEISETRSIKKIYLQEN